MKYLKSIGLLFLFATLLFTSCRKDDETGGTIPDPGPDPTPEVIVNGSFSGTVIDVNNASIENALITYGTASTMSDENGYFSFKNVEINTKGSLVTAEKEGYFYNAKFVGSKLNKQNFTKFKLIGRTLTGNFMTDAGGSVSTSDGATVEFAANAIKEVGGGAYTGNVNVYATWLDPTAADLGQIMPGDLRATNTAGAQQQLTTYGMIGVELEGDAGQELNIADGQTATIELPVPAELASNAPATIPLWHFDESSGFWVEDGEATLQGNKYVGTVSHFSFWNCDVPNDYVFIEGTVTDEDGNPIQNLQVKITENASGMVGYGWTNQDGIYAGAVPNNQELTIEILDNCGEVIYTGAIGPFADDAMIPTISVSISENFLTVSGTLTNCADEAVTNGYLKVDYGYAIAILPIDASGNFNEILSTCNTTTVETTGYDFDELKQSTTATNDVTGATTLDLGAVYICDDLTEYFNYTIDGVEFNIVDPTATNNTATGYLSLNAYDPDSLNTYSEITINLLADAPGTYTPESMWTVYGSAGQFFEFGCDGGMCDVDVEITTFESVGGFVIGSFDGTMENNQGGGGSVEINGTFKVERE